MTAPASIRVHACIAAGLTAVSLMPAHAQTAVDPEDIIVTARRRDETAMSVPVAITAVGGPELNRRAIVSIDAVARVVPSLITGDNANQQGGIVAIRGLAGADTNPFGDQAVSFNIDGVQVARASVRRMAEIDLSQIEVLKGPQALFFGKNSPAGVISIRSADPGPAFETRLQSGYEFKADEWRTEGYVSGPITDALGIRLAGYYSDMKGYVRNVAPRDGAGVFPSVTTRAPQGHELAGRLTLKWEPSDKFDARLKFTHSRVRTESPTGVNQLVSCPLGAPQTSTPVDDCRPDDMVTTGSVGPNFGTTFDPRFGNGDTFFRQSQTLAGLEMNYHLSDTVTLTSITGFYRLNLNYIGSYTNNYQEAGVLPRQILGSWARLKIRETTEEARLATSFDGPVNFMLGGLYHDTRGEETLVTGRNALAPVFVNNLRYVQDGIAYSVFGQSQVALTPELELSAGARYSYERKRLPVALSAIAAAPQNLLDITGSNFPREITFNNLSPEATLSYRPSGRLTVYGSYKEGFLSGGFNANSPTGFLAATPTGMTVSGRSSYDQQLISGFEAGVKSALFGNSLRLNLAAYTYKTTGLQVTVTNQAAQVELRNAGSVRTKGVEFDFNYRTPVDGLTLSGAVNYNKGQYIDYQANCYQGQSSATCFPQFNRVTGENARLHDLSGTQLVRAPAWTGNVGFDYESALNDDFRFGISGNASHSDGYFTDVISTPGGYQKSFQLYDASVRIMTSDEKWEVAFIGRNLSNSYYFVRTSAVPFTGSAPGASTSGTLPDMAGVVSRGRELMLRLTAKFGG